MEHRPTPQSGMVARWPGLCSRCIGPVKVGDRIVVRRGREIHVGCAPGADDE